MSDMVAVLLQVMQKQQLDEKKVVLLEANNVDEMYETLAIYEQKVPTADQVKHDDLREGLQLFLQELVAVSCLMSQMLSWTIIQDTTLLLRC
jgi:hypothetical protein